MTLWIRAVTLDYALRQRALDRCVVRVLRARCAGLNRLSTANRLLRRLVHALAAAEAAKTAGSVVPIAGQLAALAGEATIETMRASARALARTQDAALAASRLSGLAVLRCGLASHGAEALAIDRPENPEAALARVPAPLEWTSSPASTFVEVRSWDLRTSAFGWCSPTPAGEQAGLDGERYELRLDAPGPEPAARRPSSWLSF